MSLIACPECQRQISDRAAHCPHCGYPMAGAQEAQAVGVAVTTIQATSKRLKAHALLAVLVMLIGVVSVLIDAQAAVSWAIFFCGLVWLIAARLRAWWHHG